MSRNKETANYGDLEVQITRCMYEIKYEGTKKKKEHNMSKFAQILIGNGYIKKLREKHREEEWEDFWQLYVKKVLEVYAPKNRQDLLFSINGFFEEYCKLGIEERYEKYADEIKLSTKTVRNWEDKVIEEIVKKLLNEIQENNRRWLKVYADEVFAVLGSAKPDDEINEYEAETLTYDKPTPMPNSLKDTEGSSERKSRQNPMLSIKEKIMQYTKKRYNAFWDFPKEGDGFGVKIAIIFVIVVIIFAGSITRHGDSDPWTGELFIRGPDGSEKSEYNFTLDVGKGTIINIYGMPDYIDIEKLEILIYPKGTDLITVESISADTHQILPLLIRSQEIRIGEAENWEDTSKTNIATIVVVYEGAAPVCMNVTVVPDSGVGFSTELLENGGED